MRPNRNKVFHDIINAYDDGYRNIVLKGTARSGKTTAMVQAYHFIGKESSVHKKMSIVSHSFPHLQQGAIYELEQFMARENIVDIRHNQGKKEFYINKSLINYFSLDSDGNKAIGPGRDILFLNEPNRGITHQQFVDLGIRTKECIFMDYNPSGEFWLHTEGVLDDPRTILIFSSWLDNVDNLHDNQIEEFLRWKELANKGIPFWVYYWAVYGEGKDSVLAEERIMPFLKRASKVPKEAIQIPSGLDFGFFPDPTAFVQMWIVEKKSKFELDKLYIKQVVYDTKLSINSASEGTINLVDKLRSKKVNFNDQTIAESADPGAIQEMRGVNFNIEAVKKQSVEMSIRLFHDYEIYILDGSDDVFKEFDNYRYKRDKKSNKITGIPADGQDDHTIDAVRYVLMSRNFRWSI